MTRLNDPMNRMPSMERPQQSQYRSNNAMSFGGSRPGSQSGMGNQNPLQGLLTFKPSGNPMSPLRPQSPYDEYYMPKRDMADARSAISNYMSGGNQSRSSNAQPSPSAYGSGRQQQMPFLPGRGSSSTTQPQYDDLVYRFNPDAPAMSKREMVYLGGAFNKPLGSNQGSSLRDFAIPVAGGAQGSGNVWSQVGSMFGKQSPLQSKPAQSASQTSGIFGNWQRPAQALPKSQAQPGSMFDSSPQATEAGVGDMSSQDFLNLMSSLSNTPVENPNDFVLAGEGVSQPQPRTAGIFGNWQRPAQALPKSGNVWSQVGSMFDPRPGPVNQQQQKQGDGNYVSGDMTGGGYVRVPYKPELFANSPTQFGPGQSVPMRQQTPEDALADFNEEARRLAAQPREDLYGMTSKMIADGVEQGRQQGVQGANEIVDRNLSESQGYYATPSQRRSGFFSSGMGALPSDAAIMESQNRPLGDGGPAAAAARADQEDRRKRAEEAMGGPSPDGLTRYMPNPDLLAFANQDRRREDQQKFSALQDAGMFPNPQSGSNPNIGTFQREDLKAMTPAEIQFYRHKMNMATNPVYRDRINAKREARSQDLANQTKTRLEMAANRRQAAADAAGASQQLRNLMAGRGAIGGGQDGFNALMSLAAMQDPNQAFGNYGQAYNAFSRPEMAAAENQALVNMYDTQRKAQAEKDIREQISATISDPNLSGMEKESRIRALRDPYSFNEQNFPLAYKPKFSSEATNRADRYIDFQEWLKANNITDPKQISDLESQYDLKLNDQERAEALAKRRTVGDLFYGGAGAYKVPFANPLVNFATNIFARAFGFTPEAMAKNFREKSILEEKPKTQGK